MKVWSQLVIFLSGYGFSSAPLTLILGHLGLLRYVALLPKVTLRK